MCNTSREAFKIWRWSLKGGQWAVAEGYGGVITLEHTEPSRWNHKEKMFWGEGWQWLIVQGKLLGGGMALFLEISAGMGAGTDLCYILKGAAAQKGELSARLVGQAQSWLSLKADSLFTLLCWGKIIRGLASKESHAASWSFACKELAPVSMGDS